MTYQEGVVDPYLADAEDLMPESPALAQVIAQAMREMAMGLRVAIPCMVHKVQGNQLVDLQPLFKARYIGDKVVPLPVITHALVAMPSGTGGGQAYGLRLPLAVGDVGLAVFADRSLDTYAVSSGHEPVDPLDCRAHDLTDAIFFPGLCSIPGQTQDATDDVTLTNGKAVLRVQKPGTFALTNGTHEVLDLACQLAQSLQDTCDILASKAFTNTLMGPSPFIASTVALLSEQKATTAAILAKLQTLKGVP